MYKHGTLKNHESEMEYGETPTQAVLAEKGYFAANDDHDSAWSSDVMTEAKLTDSACIQTGNPSTWSHAK